jgi:iron complex outermembrane receptor protein
VASVDIYGMELELRANPWDGGFVSLDMGYLQNEYGEFTAFDPDTGADVDFSNLTIRDYSPEWTVSASIEHTFTLGDGGTLTPRLAAYYQSEYDFLTGVAEGSPPSFCLQDSYTRFQARLTYAPPTESWQASLFGYNIGDERYFDFCDSGRSGVFNYRYGVPAQWGVEFNYRWGG